MPLINKFSVTQPQDRLSINVNDKTGAITAQNLGGYGAPNPTVGSITSAKFLINKRLPDGETPVIYTITPVTPLPTTDNTLVKNILGTSFGFTGKIADGIYYGQYQLFQSSGGGPPTMVAHDAHYFALTGGIKCCLKQIRKGVAVPTTMCSCSNDSCSTCQVRLLNNAVALEKSICELVECDLLNKAQEVIDFLKLYCQNNCTTCD